MATFVMLTRLAHGALHSPAELETLEKEVKTRVEQDCPDVEWLESLAVLGPYDYLDILRTKDTETAVKVATLVRTVGHATTELWPATEWSEFKTIVHDLSAHELSGEAGSAAAAI